MMLGVESNKEADEHPEKEFQDAVFSLRPGSPAERKGPKDFCQALHTAL